MPTPPRAARTVCAAFLLAAGLGTAGTAHASAAAPAAALTAPTTPPVTVLDPGGRAWASQAAPLLVDSTGDGRPDSTAYRLTWSPTGGTVTRVQEGTAQVDARIAAIAGSTATREQRLAVAARVGTAPGVSPQDTDRIVADAAQVALWTFVAGIHPAPEPYPGGDPAADELFRTVHASLLLAPAGPPVTMTEVVATTTGPALVLLPVAPAPASPGTSAPGTPAAPTTSPRPAPTTAPSAPSAPSVAAPTPAAAPAAPAAPAATSPVSAPATTVRDAAPVAPGDASAPAVPRPSTPTRPAPTPLPTPVSPWASPFRLGARLSDPPPVAAPTPSDAAVPPGTTDTTPTATPAPAPHPDPSPSETHSAAPTSTTPDGPPVQPWPVATDPQATSGSSQAPEPDPSPEAVPTHADGAAPATSRRGVTVLPAVLAPDVIVAAQVAAAPAAKPGSTCASLRRTDISKADADYLPSLDRDGDGIACESSGQDGAVDTGGGAAAAGAAAAAESAARASAASRGSTVTTGGAGTTVTTGGAATNGSVTTGAVSTSGAVAAAGIGPGATCPELIATGHSNITRSDPLYTPARDSDGDGIACEAAGETVAGGRILAHTGAESLPLLVGALGAAGTGIGLLRLARRLRRERQEA